MIIYTDITTGDEILSDTWPLKEVDGAVYEVDGKMVTKKIGGEVIDIGANPSAEEGGGDELDSRTEQVIDICDAFRLQPTEPKHIDKKAYKDHLKGYMKKVKETLKERGADESTIQDFQTAAQKYSSKILANWDNYDTYTGQSQDPDGMHVLVDFREDGVTPYLIIWKHGLSETKV